MNLYLIQHCHRHGDDFYHVKCEDEPTTEEVVKIHNMDYEPEKGEEILIHPIEEDLILTIER